MDTYMSIQTRKELIASVKLKYSQADWKEKRKILDGLIIATGYERKYAIRILRSTQPPSKQKEKPGRKPKYGQATQEALFTCYAASNYICPKRLIPFIGELLKALKLHGHIDLPSEVEEELLSMSSATAERIIRSEKKKRGKGMTTTKPGALLKKQIQVRTFAHWEEMVPGFMEVDLVAHCGGNVHGSFLNTFTLTDIFSGWTEPMGILCRSSENVISSLNIIQGILPFKLLGIDTDNGSEFINYDLLDYCKEKAITFTRSRAYRKNDQAHVEEKNGSIVRKMVGYDRFEGIDAWNALVNLYSVLRLYVNYFQPSLKLLSKTRNGSHVTKRYDKAKTPCQRLLASKELPDKYKEKLTEEYKNLDPVKLLKRINHYQDKLWKFAWSQNKSVVISDNKKDTIDKKNPVLLIKNDDNNTRLSSNRAFRQTRKPRKKVQDRYWKIYEDVFEDDWDEICSILKTKPNITAKDLLGDLIKTKPSKYNSKQLRTFQRRVKAWRVEWLATTKTNYLKEMSDGEVNNEYLSIVLGESAT